MLVVSSKSNLGCQAGCGVAVLCSDHGQIMVGSWSDRPCIGNGDEARESFCVAGAVLGEVPLSLFVAGAVLGEVPVSLFVAGAALGEVPLSLFVAGAVLGEVKVSLFVAGAVLGEVPMSLFVAGAVLGEVVTPVAPRTVNEVSYVMRFPHVSLSA